VYSMKVRASDWEEKTITNRYANYPITKRRSSRRKRRSSRRKRRSSRRKRRSSRRKRRSSRRKRRSSRRNSRAEIFPYKEIMYIRP
jgi:hypothetical protein